MQKFLIRTILFCIISMSFMLTLHAQTAQTGTLSFSPTSVTFAPGQTQTVNVVWTGVDILGAEIHVSVGPDLQITQFTPGTQDIFFLIDSPATGEVHLGTLSANNITTGTTLFTVDILATNSCSGNGVISFVEDQVVVPDVTVSFNSATYTCSGTVPTATPTPNQNPLPTSLPQTDGTAEVINYLLPFVFISAGFGLWHLRSQTTEDIKLTSLRYPQAKN